MKAIKLVLIIFLISSQLLTLLGAEDIFQVEYLPGDKFEIEEWYNLAKTENKKYIGFTYREVRGILDVKVDENQAGMVMQGKYYVLEDTRRNSRLVSKRIDQIIPVELRIKSNGTYLVSESQAYPSFRSFPVFPNVKLQVGDKWEAYGVQVVEPLRDGIYTRVRFICEYEYMGRGEIIGKKCDIIKAQYALRYKMGEDPYGDERLTRISDSYNKANIYFDAQNKRPIAILSQVQEYYEFADGQSVKYKGNITIWYNMIVAMDRPETMEDIKEDLDESDLGEIVIRERPRTSDTDETKETIKEQIEGTGLEDVIIQERDEGISLTLNLIHFLPDQAVVRPEDLPKLNVIADTLAKIPERTFLVVGHTANLGTLEWQYELSLKRAKTIVDYLVAKGIPAKRFIYEGRGPSEPVASNDTEEERKKNRRVEVIILED